MELGNPSNGDADDLDSACTTPYVSAPSSPGRGTGGLGGYFVSAPASPTHFVFASFASSTASVSAASALNGGGTDPSVVGSFEFESSLRGSMISADEIFLNGKIRPMKLSSHLQRPQSLVPVLDLEKDDDEGVSEWRGKEETGLRGRDLRLRSGSIHRRARSMSPLRNLRFQWQEEDEVVGSHACTEEELDLKKKLEQAPASDHSPASASSSRSSSGRNSRRWIFLKDLLYRSKSEGRANGKEKEKEKFWMSLSFASSSSKDKTKPSNAPAAAQPPTPTSTSCSAAASPVHEPHTTKPKAAGPAISKKSGGSATPSEIQRPANAAGRRRGPTPSPHERLYTSNRAQAEEMRRRTFLPYRPGLLGCLGFTARSYGAMNGLARTFNPVSSS